MRRVGKITGAAAAGGLLGACLLSSGAENQGATQQPDETLAVIDDLFDMAMRYSDCRIASDVITTPEAPAEAYLQDARPAARQTVRFILELTQSGKARLASARQRQKHQAVASFMPNFVALPAIQTTEGGLERNMRLAGIVGGDKHLPLPGPEDYITTVPITIYPRTDYSEQAAIGLEVYTSASSIEPDGRQPTDVSFARECGSLLVHHEGGQQTWEPSLRHFVQMPPISNTMFP